MLGFLVTFFDHESHNMTSLRTPIDTGLFEELGTDTDRGAAIAGASIVEYSLGRALLGHMRPLSNNAVGRLFDDRGPLASFGARIEVAYAFQVCGPESREDLHRIRRVGNAFALVPRLGLSFDSMEIRQFCEALYLIDHFAYPLIPGIRVSEPLSLRDRYLCAVSLLATQLDGECVIKGGSPALKT